MMNPGHTASKTSENLEKNKKKKKKKKKGVQEMG
jgi:hypothetical protein